MHSEGRELPCNLVHIGDHQEQALGGGEGCRQCTRLQRSMDRTRGSAFGLHFGDLRYHAPKIGLPAACPFVADLGHGRAGSDRENRDRLAHPKSNRGCGLVGVDGDLIFLRQMPPLFEPAAAVREPPAWPLHNLLFATERCRRDW